MVERDVPAADVYGTHEPFTPGTGPGTQAPEPFDAGGRWQRPLERNVVVGRLLVSSCICPQCGECYAFAVPLVNGVSPMGGLDDTDPDPPCLRCELALGMPLNPDEVAAMQQLRWRWDEFRRAMREGSMVAQKGQHDAFLRLNQAAGRHALTLLHALEARYGNQQTAGVQRILNEGV